MTDATPVTKRRRLLTNSAFRDQPPAAEARSEGASAVRVRHVRTHEEFRACVDLQQEIWGADFSERVPVAILKVSQRIGGVTAGAFDEHDRLVGFVFGITGVEGRRRVHWSDMLAVRPAYRDRGIGRRLKDFQRGALRRLGVSIVYWTFDPLVARNAHFNINRLGVRVVEYVPDMYGSDTNSVLHRGLGSDRFIVAWPIGRARGRAPSRGPQVRGAPILNPVDADGIPTIPGAGAPRERMLRVAIPARIDEIQATSIPAAARWRATTRRGLTWAMGQGYAITGFYRDDEARCGFYILSKAARSRPASA